MVILASASPRRRELLTQVFPKFEIIPAKGKESADKGLPPEEYVCALAEQKCSEVFSSHPDCLVIGCDTIVVFDGKVLGKPKDEADAVKTLKALSGKTHQVLTGVCIRTRQKKLVKADVTEVTFNQLSDEFIKSYVESGSPMDKAGSYGIQDGGVVGSYFGSYTNVVGLPVELVKAMVKEALEN
ncbi:MAG: Maf family protein [Candidatus Coproplasma sp.]